MQIVQHGVIDLSRSTTEQLNLKRYVVAGNRAYVVGMMDGTFPPMGGHIKGRMGGLWAAPIKLFAGYQILLNGQPLPAAREFISAPGYVRLIYPDSGGVSISRTEFVPEDMPALLLGITLRSLEAPQHVEVELQVESQLMAAYPWSWSQPHTAEQYDQPDSGEFDRETKSLRFHEPDRPWEARVGSVRTPDDGWIVAPLDRTEGRTAIHAEGTALGVLRWDVEVPAHEHYTLWVAFAGSSEGDALDALYDALSDPLGLLDEKYANRVAVLNQARAELPDPALEAAYAWAKLNLADQKMTIAEMHVRDADEGRAFPEPAATLHHTGGVVAGYPDYAWFFGVDGAYTAYPLVAAGQIDVAKAHLRLLRAVSMNVNGATGKVVHEITPDGSVYYGANKHRGNTNETVQFAVAADLVWRWSGDARLRDDVYPFIRDGLRHCLASGRYPRGSGIVERLGMGSQTIDTAIYAIEALHGLARMARSKEDLETAAWAVAEAERLSTSFDADWWLPERDLYADSREDGPRFDGHWVTLMPMALRFAPPERAHAALDRMETAMFTGRFGLFHTANTDDRSCGTLGNGVMAVAEANYGRHAAALRYMHHIVGTLDQEMPGALAEIIHTGEPLADLHYRGMFMQAWATYGVLWPVVNNFLGIWPDAPAERLHVIPDMPLDWPAITLHALPIGRYRFDIIAQRVTDTEGSTGQQLITSVTTTSFEAGWALLIGHTLPEGAEVASVTLNGMTADYTIREVAGRRQVQTEARAVDTQTLVITLA